MSKQTLLTQGAGWFDLAQLGAAPAAPAAGTNRLYVDAGGLLQLASPAGSQPSRRVVTDWGVGTAFPTTGLGRGDVYTHSGIGCMFLWNGAMWRQATPITAGTLAQLQATATTYGATIPHDGVEAYVTGTKTPYLWDTASASWVNSWAEDSGWVNVTINGSYQAMAGFPPQVRKVGKTAFMRGGWASGAGTGIVSNPTNFGGVGTLPAGFAPAQQLYVLMMSSSSSVWGRGALNADGSVDITTNSTGLGTYYKFDGTTWPLA